MGRAVGLASRMWSSSVKDFSFGCFGRGALAAMPVALTSPSAPSGLSENLCGSVDLSPLISFRPSLVGTSALAP
eukprot:3809723-Prorocentrum_lima.AAC.1